MRKRDFKLALTELTPEAVSGHPFAQEALGDLYASGLGVKRDMKSACDWWEKAALQGRLSAQHNLGTCFARGEGRAADVKEAMVWLQSAADQGYDQALCTMGELMLTGFGDKDEGIALCIQAAAKGAARAQVTVGGLYLTGTHVKKNLKEAAKWMEMAAAQGETNAEYTFGLMNRFGHGIEKNDADAEVWLEKAAQKGHPKAQYQLGEVQFVLAIDPNDKSINAGKIVSAYYWLSVSRPFLKNEKQIKDADRLISLIREMMPEDMQTKVDKNVAKYLQDLKASVDNRN